MPDVVKLDKSQAEAIASAMLEPDRRTQEHIRLKRIARERRLAEGRAFARFVALGALLGAGVAYFSGHGFYAGIIGGGVPGAAVGWLFNRTRRRGGLP